MPYDLGATIKDLRKKNNLTQLQLAKLLNVSEATICKYESNNATPPFETLRTLAVTFNVSMDTLCGIRHAGTIPVHGLTENQIEILNELIEMFKYGCWRKGEFSHEQLEILGKIVTEFSNK